MPFAHVCLVIAVLPQAASLTILDRRLAPLGHPSATLLAWFSFTTSSLPGLGSTFSSSARPMLCVPALKAALLLFSIPCCHCPFTACAATCRCQRSHGEGVAREPQRLVSPASAQSARTEERVVSVADAIDGHVVAGFAGACPRHRCGGSSQSGSRSSVSR